MSRIGEDAIRCSVMRSSRFLFGVSLGEDGGYNGSSIASRDAIGDNQYQWRVDENSCTAIRDIPLLEM